ncbi:hypothetical protein ASG90_20110 [Nocardioides sp. Soil797]|nr:hypothetical protein ASG90_20110 [Nocardioides sp. Soil797]
MRLRIATATLASLLLLIPLAACNDGGSDEPESTASDTSSSTPSTSPSSEDPSPTDTGPTIPPDAQGTDEASAKAFVRFYFETLSDAMESGDTTPLRQLATEKCETCTNLVRLIGGTYRKGGSYETEGWRVAKSLRGPAQPGGRKSLLLKTIQEERVLYDSKGDGVDTQPRMETPMRAILAPVEGEWRMWRLDIIE